MGLFLFYFFCDKYSCGLAFLTLPLSARYGTTQRDATRVRTVAGSGRSQTVRYLDYCEFF